MSAAAFGAVLMVWKLRDTYCRAVLAYSQRINLDGTPSAEHVDDEARQKAKEQLDRIAARKVKKAAKMQHKRRTIGCSTPTDSSTARMPKRLPSSESPGSRRSIGTSARISTPSVLSPLSAR